MWQFYSMAGAISGFLDDYSYEVLILLIILRKILFWLNRIFF